METRLQTTTLEVTKLAQMIHHAYCSNIKAEHIETIAVTSQNHPLLVDKWYCENLYAAKFILELLTQNPHIETEKAAEKVHDNWLARNFMRAKPHQNQPYEHLSETEKNKDRRVVHLAKKLLNQ